MSASTSVSAEGNISYEVKNNDEEEQQVNIHLYENVIVNENSVNIVPIKINKFVETLRYFLPVWSQGVGFLFWEFICNLCISSLAIFDALILSWSKLLSMNTWSKHWTLLNIT